jgi:hypothetical protein
MDQADGIWAGDILLLECGRQVTATATASTGMIPIHPAFNGGPETYLPEIPFEDAIAARDRFAGQMKALGISPAMLGRAMFPVLT